MKTFTFQARGGFVIKMLVHKKSTCQSIVFLLQVSLLLLSCSVPPLSLKPLIRADLSVVWASEQGRWWWCVAVMVCPLSLSHVTVSVNTGRNQNSAGMYFSLSQRKTGTSSSKLLLI